MRLPLTCPGFGSGVKRSRADSLAGPGTPGPPDYAPEISLSESLITCHPPSMPLPFVLNIGAPT